MADNNQNKTRPNSLKPYEFIATLPENQQADAKTLIQIMEEVSGEKAVMWGSRIVGFGSYHYKYESGREGDWARIGFAPGKGKFSLYLTCDASELETELRNLGKHTAGKGCIYINKLADVDILKLKKLVEVAYSTPDPYET